MAAKKQSKRNVKVETREQTTEKKNPCPGCDLDCTTCKVNGAKTLRRAACETLRRDSKSISDSLAAKAKGGDANSAKLLLLLTEKQPVKDGAKKKTLRGKSAQALAEEPEWSEEMVETSTAPGTGSWEPQG